MASYSYGKTVQTDTVTGETFWGDFDRRHAFNAAAAYRVSDRTRVAVVFRGATNVPIAGYFAARDGAVVVGGGFLGFGVFGICVNQVRPAGNDGNGCSRPGADVVLECVRERSRDLVSD
jgi:hypothetical protein